jgi:hypothetical protein
MVVLLAVCLSGAVAAQPDKTVALEKARAKFEKDIAKLDETFLTGIDKTIVKALSANNKALHEKLTYERDQFVTNRILPTTFSSEAYHKQRNQAIATLQGVYQPVLSELNKAKKFEEMHAIEDELSNVLKSGRGYGLAFPADLDAKPVFLIENKSTGLVIDLSPKLGDHPEAIAAAREKDNNKKQTQLWRIERDEGRFILRNVGTKNVLIGVKMAGSILSTWAQNPEMGTEARGYFLLNEIRREIVIAAAVGELVVTVTEKKDKGVTTSYVTYEKKATPPTAAQLWTLVEVK